MVLPEELVNYVKDQLSQDVAVATIISDVKAKGYQISSSTIYKIRATIGPKRGEHHMYPILPPTGMPFALDMNPQMQIKMTQKKEETEPSPTPVWDFQPPQYDKSEYILASVDI